MNSNKLIIFLVALVAILAAFMYYLFRIQSQKTLVFTTKTIHK